MIGFTFIHCDKDKELTDIENRNSYPFEVTTSNNDITTGKEVGETIELVYDINRKYDGNISKDTIKYQLISDKLGFEATDNQGNRLELNKTYVLKSSPLKINYKATEKGEHNVGVKFTNTKGYDKEIKNKLYFDGYGLNILLKEKENYLNAKNTFEYSLKGMNNRNVNYIVTIVEDEGNGTFYVKGNNDQDYSFKKGDSFEITSTEGTKEFFYKTKNVTRAGKEGDKIVLEVKPKSGNQSQTETFTFLLKNVWNDYKAVVYFDKDSNPIIFPNVKYEITLNIEEENSLVDLDYNYLVKFDQRIESDTRGQTIQDLDFYYGDNLIQNNEIKLKKGKHTLYFVSKNKIFAEDILSYNVYLKVYNDINLSNYVVTDFDISNYSVWKYPNFSISGISSQGEVCLSGEHLGLCLGKKGMGYKVYVTTWSFSQYENEKIDYKIKGSIKGNQSKEISIAERYKQNTTWFFSPPGERDDEPYYGRLYFVMTHDKYGEIIKMEIDVTKNETFYLTNDNPNIVLGGDFSSR